MRRCSAPKACPLEGAIDIGFAAACAKGVGAMDTLVALTVEYMITRKPCGATLASLQALRHPMADVKMQLELARSMSCFASLKLSEPAPQRRRALSQTKVQLGQSTRFIGQQCIQLHGGIGVTDEVAVSHYFTRLTMLKLAFGDTLHRLAEVSERMAGGLGAASLTAAGVTVAADATARGAGCGAPRRHASGCPRIAGTRRRRRNTRIARGVTQVTDRGQ